MWTTIERKTARTLGLARRVAHLLGPDAALLPRLASRRVFADVSGVVSIASA